MVSCLHPGDLWCIHFEFSFCRFSVVTGCHRLRRCRYRVSCESECVAPEPGGSATEDGQCPCIWATVFNSLLRAISVLDHPWKTSGIVCHVLSPQMAWRNEPTHPEYGDHELWEPAPECHGDSNTDADIFGYGRRYG